MKIEKRIKLAMKIFCFFFKIGFFTYGGGWSIIAQMEKEFIEKEKWITKEELLDIVSVGKSLPGLMIGNVSLMFGYRIGGFICAFAAVIGIVCPSLIVLMIITRLYEMFRNNIYVAGVMTGIRAAIAPIIGFAGMQLMSGALKKLSCYLIMIVAFLLCVFTRMNIVLIIVLSGLIGFLIDRDEKQEDKND